LICMPLASFSPHSIGLTLRWICNGRKHNWWVCCSVVALINDRVFLACIMTVYLSFELYACCSIPILSVVLGYCRIVEPYICFLSLQEAPCWMTRWHALPPFSSKV
jgi:hypothetical protein